MRRTSVDGARVPEDMVESSSTRAGYRAVPAHEGQPALARSHAPVYGTVKPSRSPSTLVLSAALLLSLVLLLVLLVPDMPVGSRLRAALFNAAPRGGGPAPTSQLSAPAVGSLNKFGLSLFARLAAGEGGGNVVISPASVASALTLAAAGATAGSQAEKELEALLGAGFAAPSGDSDPAVTLTVANAAWVAGSVHDSYKQDVKKALGADVFPPPKSISEVNDWVSKATRGNINSIMDSVPSPLVALLVNAVFFKASWTTSFNPAFTTDAPFFGPRGSDGGEPVATVKMMTHRKQSFRYTETRVKNRPDQTVKIVELLYGKKEEYAATIVVPTGQMTVGELAGLFKNGDTTLWDDWVGELVSTKLEVLAMPRFKVEYGAQSLNAPLQDMGIKAAFGSDRSNPQFLRMTADKDAYLSDVLHKATIECNEEGTVASAASAAVVLSRSMPRELPSVVLNRPFLFTIRDRMSGAILFMARIDKPVSL